MKALLNVCSKIAILFSFGNINCLLCFLFFAVCFPRFPLACEASFVLLVPSRGWKVYSLSESSTLVFQTVNSPVYFLICLLYSLPEELHKGRCRNSSMCLSPHPSLFIPSWFGTFAFCSVTIIPTDVQPYFYIYTNTMFAIHS